MLSTLRARNFILIDELELSLGSSLNVITGETGAGKSILVGALHLVLGGRSSPDQVRPGAEQAELEASFLVSPALRASLGESGVPVEDDELVVRRVVHTNGRSRCYLNGRLCSLGELARLGRELVDIASQHESVALTDPGTHLGYLDRFGRLEARRDAVAAEVERLEALARESAHVRAAERTRAEREAFLDFQIGTIDAVSPRSGELDELRHERSRLRHAGRLSDVIRRAADRLEEGDSPLSDELGRLAREVAAAADLDASLAPFSQRLEASFAEVRELGRDLGRYAERVESNPARLAEVEERLYKLEQLLRQHGPAEDDVLAARARLAAERDALRGAEARLAGLEAELAQGLARAGVLAKELSAQRSQAARALGEAISRELAELGMGGARVVIDVAPLVGDGELVFEGARLGRDGLDRVELLIAPNRGVDPRPLRKIASGGELSRALLALKRVLAEAGPRAMYVFDEVDTGIGGAVAEKIGRAIADVARHHQVVCITHLATIAAFGDHHFVVEKHHGAERTASTVVRVEGPRRTDELARMLAGGTVGAAARSAAEELVAAARSASPDPAREPAPRPAPSAAPPPAEPAKPKARKKP